MLRKIKKIIPKTHPKNVLQNLPQNFILDLKGSYLRLKHKSYSLFESSGIDEKRKILKLVFSNFSLNGSKLDYTIRKPFDMFIKTASCPIELGLVDEFRTYLLQNIA